MPGNVLKCLPSSSISSGMADSVADLVSILNEYFGLLFSILLIYFRPPGPVTVVVVTTEPGEVGLFDVDLPIVSLVQTLWHLIVF